MVWPCKIISQRLRAVFSDKNSSCILNLHHILKGVGCDNLHMLRRNLIGCLNSLIHVLCDQDVAEIIQGLLDDLFSGENFYKALYLLVNLVCKFPAGSDQDSAGQLVMLSLRKKVCCHIAWVGSFIGQYQDLTWTCNRVNAYIAIYCFLCQGYENISRAYDLVYLWNAFCTVSQSSHCLGSSNLVDLICSGFSGCYQCGSAYLAVLSRRGGHYNMGYSCNFGRHNIHKYRGRINCLSAWNIDTYAV